VRTPPQFKPYFWGIGGYDGEALFFPPESKDHVSYSVFPRDDAEPVSCTVRTLASIRWMLYHGDIGLLKLDIEGSEDTVIPDIMRSEDRPLQLLVELHKCLGRNRMELLFHGIIRSGYDLFAHRGYNYSFVRAQ
jgi:hypothetical protein